MANILFLETPAVWLVFCFLEQTYFSSIIYTDGGNEIWKYAFAKVKVNGTTFIPFYGLFHNGTNGTKKELTILFKDDVVAKYTMAESAINTKSGWSD